jgi:hypothetical protein
MKTQNAGGKPVNLTVLSGPNLFKLYLSLFLLFLLCPGSYGQLPVGKNRIAASSVADAELEQRVRNTLKQNSQKLQLVENKGQSGLPQHVVAYFTSYNETVFIEKDRLRIVVVEPGGNNKSEKRTDDNSRISELSSINNCRYNTFSIGFKGSMGFTELKSEKPFATKRNFINAQSIHNNNITADCFAEITLKNIYPGIDLRLYSQEDGHLEFDWIVWPGYNAARIKMEFTGQENLEISANGNLRVKLALGTFTMRLPESYYITPAGKQQVHAKFWMTGKNEVRFRGFDKRAKKYPLVIDPDLLWGTFFDGASATFDEYLYGIEYNYSNQKIYCAGVSNQQVSTTYAAALSSGYNGTFEALQDVLVYALSNNGATIDYITYLGGVNNDVATGISISGSSIFVCGHTTSTDFPVTDGSGGTTAAFDNSYGGAKDGFVAVLNSTLNQLSYCTYLGGGGDDEALTIRATGASSFDVSLHLYAILPTASPNYLVAFADNSFGGAEEAWIAGFSSFNSIGFGTYIGGSDVDVVNDFQVLGDGDIVFTGTTRQITEVNGTVSSNATGSDVLFGRINVPVSGSVSFSVVEKLGGNGTDNGYGIYSIGDTISILVGQTKSANLPLGTGSIFQGTLGGGVDGFIARIKNDGTGGYKASFTGGTGSDILVSVRPITVNNQAVLLSFGTTTSTNLPVLNYNSGTFYSSANSGGQDMMFLITDLDITSKYYLSYVGGTENDYLGKTGAPIGSNHLFYNAVDSVLYLGTTTHSSQTTHAPLFVGRGAADIANSGIPVFDELKDNGINDTHVIIAISTRSLYVLLGVKWLNFRTKILSDCSVQLSWATANEENVLRYIIERSIDGRNFEIIDSLPSGSNAYSYNDNNADAANGKVHYRIMAKEMDGSLSYSTVQFIRLCGHQQNVINIYPTVVQNSFTVSGLNSGQIRDITVEVADAAGKIIFIEQVPGFFNSQTVFLKSKPPCGTYFVILKNNKTGAILLTRKIIIGY